MEFEYEISADDYAAAAILYQNLSGKRSASRWMFAGACLLIICLLERDRGLSPILLGAIGVWWIWAGIARAFPGNYLGRHYRKHYQKLGLEGKKYRASVNQDGFQVIAENSSWNYRWANVLLKGEDNRVFVLFAGATLFIFAKRYLLDQQQRELRSLADLPPR